MIYSLNIEYRELNILRVRFLRSLQESKGVIQIGEFSKMLKCVIRNCPKKLEDLLIEQTRGENNTINYHKLCEILNLFQYHLHYMK